MNHRHDRPAPGDRINPHRLYRNHDDRILCGVCSGIADYFGLNRRAVRLVTLIAAFPFTPFVITGYIILCLILPVKPRDLYATPEEETFWRKTTIEPKNTFGEIRHRFRELEMRLQRMEAYLTSKRYEIDRELKGS